MKTDQTFYSYNAIFWQKLFGNLQIIHSKEAGGGYLVFLRGIPDFLTKGGPKPSQDVHPFTASKNTSFFLSNYLGDPGEDVVVHGHGGKRWQHCKTK